MKFNFKIKHIVLVSNLVVMTLFCLVVLTYIEQEYENIRIADYMATQEVVDYNLSQILYQEVDSVQTLASVTANNPTIINLIDNFEDDDNFEHNDAFTKNVNQNLSEVAYANYDIESVNLVLHDLAYKTSLTNSAYDFDGYFSDEFKESVSTSSKLWLPTRENDFSEYTSTKYILTYVQKIYSSKLDGNTIGYVAINISENFLYEILKEMQDVDTTLRVLIDENNNILSSTDRALLGVNLADTEYLYLLPYLSGNEISEAFMLDDYTISIFEMENNWRLVSISDINVIIAPIKETSKVIRMVSVACLLIMAVLASVISHFISKPIVSLSKDVDRYKDTEILDERIEFETNIQEVNVLILAFNDLITKRQQLFEHLKEKEKEQMQNELRLLQAQINPHFLYNTLETINWHALKKGDMEMSRLVVLLAEFLRVGLNKGNWIYHLNDEINHISSYIEIQQIRSNFAISFHVDVDKKCKNLTMIKLLLQPIVENSILHGFASKGGRGNIDLKVALHGENIIFTVQDDGCGMSEEMLAQLLQNEASSTGYGMKNVNNRIKLYYGEEYGMKITSEIGKGTCVTICIPTKTKEEFLF